MYIKWKWDNADPAQQQQYNVIIHKSPWIKIHNRNSHVSSSRCLVNSFVGQSLKQGWATPPYSGLNKTFKLSELLFSTIMRFYTPDY